MLSFLCPTCRNPGQVLNVPYIQSLVRYHTLLYTLQYRFDSASVKPNVSGWNELRSSTTISSTRSDSPLITFHHDLYAYFHGKTPSAITQAISKMLIMLCVLLESAVSLDRLKSSNVSHSRKCLFLRR